MGMTDMQFKAYLSNLVAELKEIMKLNPDNEKLQALITRLEEQLKM